MLHEVMESSLQQCKLISNCLLVSCCITWLVTGWADIRLLAPRAELRLLLTGGSALIDGSKLSFLGEALRALLVMETRTLTVCCTGQEQVESISM